ncbi:MAG: cytochrome C oxidase subunit IV family protein [Myxococcota bacterium]
MSEEAHHNYVRIWAWLVVLLVVSVIGPFIGEAAGLQWITLTTAFGIAFVKAYLVVVNFMHLGNEQKFVSYFVATALVFMLLFFAGTAPDVMKAEGTNWKKPAWIAAAAVAAGDDHGSDEHH